MMHFNLSGVSECGVKSRWNLFAAYDASSREIVDLMLMLFCPESRLLDRNFHVRFKVGCIKVCSPIVTNMLINKCLYLFGEVFDSQILWVVESGFVPFIGKER